MANGDDYIYIIIFICHRVRVQDLLDTILMLDGTKVKQGINLLNCRRLHITSDVKVVIGCPRPPISHYSRGLVPNSDFVGPETDQISLSIWSPRQHQSPFLSHVTAGIWVCT